MRKCYVIIGLHADENGYSSWVSAVKSSRKKAEECCKLLRAARPENNYSIQVEVIE